MPKLQGYGFTSQPTYHFLLVRQKILKKQGSQAVSNLEPFYKPDGVSDTSDSGIKERVRYLKSTYLPRKAIL